MGKIFCKEKIPPGDFKVITPKNPLINNQAYKHKESYHYPGLSQNTNLQVNLRQYQIELDLRVAFFPLMHKS